MFLEVLMSFFSRKRKKVQAIRNRQQEDNRHRPASMAAIKPSERTIENVLQEPHIAKKWKYANALDALRLKLVDRKTVTVHKYSGQTNVSLMAFNSFVQAAYRLNPSIAVTKLINNIYNAFVAKHSNKFDAEEFWMYMYILSRNPYEVNFSCRRVSTEIVKNILAKLPVQAFKRMIPDECKIIISNFHHSAEILNSKEFIEVFQKWIWSARRPSSRHKIRLENLNVSMDNFQYSYERTNEEFAFVCYCMRLKKSHFRTWKQLYHDLLEFRRLKRLLVESEKRRGIRKLQRRTRHFRRLRITKEQARLQYLFILNRRWRKRARAKRQHRLSRLELMTHCFYLFLSRALLNDWNDAAQEAKGLDLARPYFDAFIKKKWTRKWKAYTKEQIRLRKVEILRKTIREAEDAEFEKDVDETETFFLSDFQKKQRDIRVKEKAERLEKERIEEMWAVQRHKVKGVAIKMKQEHERESHKASTKLKAKQFSSNFFAGMQKKVVAAAERKCIEFLGLPDGAAKLKKRIRDALDENVQEVRLRIRQGKGRVYDSDWSALVQEGEISVAAPIAYHNSKTQESFLFSGMNKKRAKAIAIADCVAEAREAARNAFEARRAEDERHFHQVYMATKIQSKFRMKLGWRAAVKEVQRLWVKVYDATSDSTYYYQTRDRIVAWEKPKLLGHFGDIKFLSMWQVKFDDEMLAYVYYHRKSPWEKSVAKPNNIIMCESCGFYYARRRCLDDCCFDNNDAYVYTCFPCYDRYHEQYTRRKSILYREIEEHACVICEQNTGTLYCRGCNFGDVYCKNCYHAIHMRGEFQYHPHPIEINEQKSNNGGGFL